MAFANLHDDRIRPQADGPFFHTIMHDEDTMGAGPNIAVEVR